MTFWLIFYLQSKHDLKDKSQLLYLVRKFPEGIAVIDLKDSYPTVMEDLQVSAICGCLILLDQLLCYGIHVLIRAQEIHQRGWELTRTRKKKKKPIPIKKKNKT